MPLKKSKGNMYPWVTHTHSHLGGECPHKCSYCYVDNPRFGRPQRYQGSPRLLEDELKVKYGSDKVIFIDNCGDLFAEGVATEFAERVIEHCCAWPDNTYVFQTKNPGKLLILLSFGLLKFPKTFMVGTTIETNREDVIGRSSFAPSPMERYEAMKAIKTPKFCTVEPVLDFDVDVMAEWLISMGTKGKEYFVNIGADSKGHGLPEPSAEKILALVKELEKAKIEIRKKHNLDRLLQA